MYQADERSLSIRIDPGVARRQLRFFRGWAIGLTIVAGWGYLWFGLVLAFGQLLIPSTDSRLGVPVHVLIGLAGIVAVSVFAAVAIFMWINVRRIQRRNPPDAIAFGADDHALEMLEVGRVSWNDVASVVVYDYQQPVRPSITIGGRLGGMAGQQMARSMNLDQMRIVQVDLRDGRQARAVIGPYLDQPAFEHFMARMQSVTTARHVPFVAQHEAARVP